MVHILDPGSPNDERSIPLATRRKTFIPNERRDERAKETMLAAERLAKKKCPGVETRSLSATYSCVGLVFASRRTWVDSDCVQKILEDDGYVRLSREEDAVRGDVVVYRKSLYGPIEHVGLVVRTPQRGIAGLLAKPMLVLSQWGADGEYFHEPQNVPEEYGTVREYYSERRQLR